MNNLILKTYNATSRMLLISIKPLFLRVQAREAVREREDIMYGLNEIQSGPSWLYLISVGFEVT